MAVNLNSPGVSITDQDSSQFVTTVSSTVAAYIGFATKGPIGVPTLVTSKQSFIDTFGIPSTVSPWGALGVFRAFNQTNQVLFTRVADTTTSKKALGASAVLLNDSPALAGYQQFAPTSSVTFGSYTASGAYDFSLSINGGAAIVVPLSAPTSGDWSLTNVASQINTIITNPTAGYQEFGYSFASVKKVSSIIKNTYLRFGVTKDAVIVHGANNDLEVLLTSGMSVTDYVTAFTTALTQGSSPIGKLAWAPPPTLTAGTIPAVPQGGANQFVVGSATTYSVTVGGTNVPFTPVISASYTYQNLVADINSAIALIPALVSNGVRAFLDATGLVFTSSLYGTVATTAVAITAGGTGTNLLTLTAVVGSATVVAGAAGVSASTFSVTYNSITNRLRISSVPPTSASTPAAGSQLVISAPFLGNLGNLTDASNTLNTNTAISAFGGLLQPNVGKWPFQTGLNASIDSAGKIRITSGTTGVSSSVAISTDVTAAPAIANGAPTYTVGGFSTTVNNADLNALLATSTAVAGTAAVLPSSVDNIEFASIDTGTSTGLLSVQVTSAVDGFSGTTIYTIYVYYNSVLKETFAGVTLNPTDPKFFATVMNALPANGGSSYVNVNYNYRSQVAGIVTSVALGIAGTGYTTGPVTLSQTGSGNNATATIVASAGVITSITLTAGGTGYVAGTVNITQVGGSSGTATVAVSSGNIVLPTGTYVLGKVNANISVIGTTPYDLVVNNSLGTYGYRVGTDGIPTSGGSALFVAALGSSSPLANTELYDFHVLATPDNNAEETQNAALQLYTARSGDFIYVSDPPIAKSYTQVVDWMNGKNNQGRSTAINSDGAVVYWPWLLEYNSYTASNVWAPPSVWIVEKYLEIDNNYAPWAAVAGDTRGRVIAQGYETSPSIAQRDYLYGGLNAVNPIVNFQSKGLEIYGQKTAYRANSALNRVNVKRMQIYIKKLIRLAMNGFVFEANSTDTLNRMTNFINSILEPVRQRNGVSSYKVTFVADPVNPNLVTGNVKIVPIGTIEFININIIVLPSGTVIS